MIHDVIITSDYGPAGSPSDSGLNSLQDEFQELAEAIPGLPGDDYPVFSQPPDTSFTCGDKIEVGVMWGPMTGSVMTSFSGLLRRSRS